MTPKTLRAVILVVLFHKSQINILMTGAADRRIQTGDIRLVTILTGKRHPITACCMRL